MIFHDIICDQPLGSTIQKQLLPQTTFKIILYFFFKYDKKKFIITNFFKIFSKNIVQYKKKGFESTQIVYTCIHSSKDFLNIILVNGRSLKSICLVGLLMTILLYQVKKMFVSVILMIPRRQRNIKVHKDF